MRNAFGKKRVSLSSGSLAGKMIRFVFVFVLIMGSIFMIMFGIRLRDLYNRLKWWEQQELEMISEHTGSSLTDITEANLKSLILSSAERCDDDFLIVKQDLLVLRSQVEDVFRHPENYKPRKIEPPRMENRDVPVLQLLAPNGYENISPETYEMAQRLANLEPTMREIILSQDFIIDSYICTPDGVTISFDSLSDRKFDEAGNLKDYDPRERPWYRGALETEDVYFASTGKSVLYGFREIVYSTPVYVDGKLVAVLEGCLHMEAMSEFMKGREIGEEGFAVLINKDGELCYSTKEKGELATVDDEILNVRESADPELRAVIGKVLSGRTDVEKVHVDGREYYAAYGYIPTSGWAQIFFVSVEEVMEPADQLLLDMEENSRGNIAKENRAMNLSVVGAAVALLTIMILANIVVSRRTRKRVAPIVRMTEQLNEFKGVNMFFEMEDAYRTGDEIQVLAENFGAMAEKLRNYIDEMVDEMSAKSRVKTELSLATQIQADMLPNIFPAFPERPEFDIYASMTPAKEVGGDFYDFFFVGENHLAIVMADVSGKGVPAAMFMMMAKCMIQSQMVAKHDPAAVLEEVNNLIFANNREKMFVTVWLGLLDIASGVLTATNAGHEYPVFKEPDGGFEIVKDKHGFVLGARKNRKYTDYEIQMKPGSKLFVYTDGVPEATNSAEELFGMERTLAAVNLAAALSPKAILESVDSEVKKFVGDAEQFDDLTMLCIEYKGVQAAADAAELKLQGEGTAPEAFLQEPQAGTAGDGAAVKELTLRAVVESMDPVMEMIDGQLVSMDCPAMPKGQIDIAVDELFGNIAYYAYEDGDGEVTVRIERTGEGNGVRITFIDGGKPFDPLGVAEPDVTLPASKRKKGGLGIHLVKNTMDDVAYKYEDGKNILCITKSW